MKKRTEGECPFEGDGPYRTSAKPVLSEDTRMTLFVLFVMLGPSFVLAAFMSFMGWYMTPEPEPDPAPIYCEASPIPKGPSCPVCVAPELSHRERGCIALCDGAQNVAWFARNSSHGYICQCAHGPEFHMGLGGLFGDD